MIEKHKKLAEKARISLRETGYENHVSVIVGDGALENEENAPYDEILVTASSPKKDSTTPKGTIEGWRNSLYSSRFV